MSETFEAAEMQDLFRMLCSHVWILGSPWQACKVYIQGRACGGGSSLGDEFLGEKSPQVPGAPQRATHPVSSQSRHDPPRQVMIDDQSGEIHNNQRCTWQDSNCSW